MAARGQAQRALSWCAQHLSQGAARRYGVGIQRRPAKKRSETKKEVKGTRKSTRKKAPLAGTMREMGNHFFQPLHSTRRSLCSVRQWPCFICAWHIWGRPCCNEDQAAGAGKRSGQLEAIKEKKIKLKKVMGGWANVRARAKGWQGPGIKARRPKSWRNEAATCVSQEEKQSSELLACTVQAMRHCV